MEKFEIHTGIAAPLERSDVDTDQIIPAVYLKRVTRSGFEDGLFAAWRKDPDFVLNQEPYQNASILIAGENFGTGSSREHAVWALLDYGFRVVISPRYGDIFKNNAAKAGLLTAEVTQEDLVKLWQLTKEKPGLELTVNLEEQKIYAANLVLPFQIPAFTKTRLLAGLDDIGHTLQFEAEITAFEKQRPDFKPKTLPAKTLD